MFTVRETRPEDASEILALVHASDIAVVGFADFDLEEVEEGIAGPKSVVACEGDRIIAWGYLTNATDGPRDFLEVYIHPEHGRPAQRPLLELLLAEVRRRGKYARSAAVAIEEPWIEAITAQGFLFVKQHARMTVDLPVALDPPTHTVRPVTEPELPTFYEVIDTAFHDMLDYQPRTYEQWRSRFTPRWDDWLVCEVDGTIAGALQSGTDGWVEYLGVLAPFRRRGVGRALLLTAFELYAKQGHAKAGLGVDMANPTQAIKLYTSVGMTPAYQANVYEKSF